MALSFSGSCNVPLGELSSLHMVAVPISDVCKRIGQGPDSRPNNTTSLTRNWPGDAASAGNPYPACHTPGVVMTKLSVVKNIPIPARLPTSRALARLVQPLLVTQWQFPLRRGRARNFARPECDK